MKVIVLDPGHGGSDPGACGNGIQEKVPNLIIGLATREELKRYECIVKMTRTADTYVSLSARAAMGRGADLFVSEHCNANSSHIRGFETYCYSGALLPPTLGYRDAIHGAVYPYLRGLGVPDGGRRRADHYVTREPKCPAVLMEYLYVSNALDAALLKQNTVLKELGRLTAQGIARALGLKLRAGQPDPQPSEGTFIRGPAEATVTQAQEWARSRGAHLRFIAIAPVYWKYGAITGIRPEVLYAQSAKETAFGRFGGAVTPDQNNWCGVKTRNATGDLREDHESFSTPEEGVRAHFNHMYAYLGRPPIGEPHGRYYVVLALPWAGKIEYVEELGGRWAPAANYGESIVKDYLTPLLATPDPGGQVVEPPEPEPGPEMDSLMELLQEVLVLLKKILGE